MNSNKIINVDTCTLGTDATNKTYVDGLIGSFLTESAADLRYYQNTTTLDAITLPAAVVSLNS